MMRALLAAMMSIALLISLSACAAQTEPRHEGLTSASLGGLEIRLIDEQGRCAVARADSAPLVLDMKWPCRFSEDQQKKVRVEDYRKALVVMVERSEPLPPPSTECATDLQSIRLYKGKLDVSPVSRVAACGPGYWDQKVLIWQFDW
ncbi:hypothetical protein TRP66_07460 [Pseudomonas sp. JDS28PS106]|uniref:hypothetical protein n=1 Tax=Pseudomonas sp. JDS28PS106 TaxID=2497235 RepID=UPI002FD3EE3F